MVSKNLRAMGKMSQVPTHPDLVVFGSIHPLPPHTPPMLPNTSNGFKITRSRGCFYFSSTVGPGTGAVFATYGARDKTG
jgi:hypothetical protein